MPPTDRFDCIVMGAGISGVTAARDIRRAGFRVLLLEASDRVGGRMKTIRDYVQAPGFATADWPLEAGAEFIHVPDTARYIAFRAELISHGFECVPFPKFEVLGKGHNRVTFPDWPEVRRLWATIQSDNDINDMMCVISDVGKIRSKIDQSVGQYLDSRNFRGRGRTMARYALSAHTPGRLDDLIDDISILGLVADEIPDQLLAQSECKIARNGAWCGYDALPKAIAAQITSPTATGPQGEMRLNQPVARVERVKSGANSNIRITTEDGTVVTGRSAVCTFSVGVLDPVNGLGDVIFGPLLTPAKREALKVVRMGAITKASLEFKTCVWGDKAHMSVLSNPTVGEGADQTWARTFFSAFPGSERGPYVLTALMMGRDHLGISSMNDSDAWKFLFRVIESIFNRAPGAAPWRPEDVLVGRMENGEFVPNFLRTDWSRHPHIMGGNSYITFGADSTVHPRDARKILMDPTETRPLFWAGEATAPAHNPLWQPLSVHGAFMSGQRVAKQVEQHLRGSAITHESLTALTETKPRKGAKAAKSAVKTALLNGAPKRKPPRRKVELTLTLDADEIEILKHYAAEHTEGDETTAMTRLFHSALRVMT